VAERFGAGLYVLGSVVEVGGRLEATASLYDARNQVQATAQARAASRGEALDVVAQLARQLLASRYQGPAEELTRLALVTTASSPALRAYLEGERRLRAGRFEDAMEAFQQAVGADSAFALAWYRLSVAAEWAQQGELMQVAAERAARLTNRLPPRARPLAEALRALRQGEAERAQRLYGEALRADPHDVEAWLQLGEVQFHYGPLRGSPIEGAATAWNQVATLEPQNGLAAVHLARIAAAQDDSAWLAAHVAPLGGAGWGGDDRLLEMAALRAFARRDTAEEARVAAELRRAPPVVAIHVANDVATYSRNLDGAERLARTIAGLPNGGAWFAALDGSQLRLGAGRLAAGRAEMAALGRELVEWRVVHPALVATLPFFPPDRALLARLRDELTAWSAPPPPASAQFTLFTIHSQSLPHLRAYLLGAVSAALGDTAAALAHADALERLPGPPEVQRLARDLALGVRARVARAQGRAADALRLLEQMRTVAPREYSGQSPFFARAAERWLRAELLRELGRHDEALRWYATLGELTPYELVYLAPAHLRRGEIHERLGARAEAAAQYARAVALWRDADPALQPAVAEARRRLAALGGVR
jgi:tetratricopeptide (TPR) repeat protein